MLLKRYLEDINSSMMIAEEITSIFGKLVRLGNLLLRPCTESPVPYHAGIVRCLVETYPFINDVEGMVC